VTAVGLVTAALLWMYDKVVRTGGAVSKP